MSQDVSHTFNLSPWYFWMCIAKFIRDLACCLTHDLEATLDRKAQLAIVNEIF